jgi:hypothetical protein
LQPSKRATSFRSGTATTGIIIAIITGMAGVTTVTNAMIGIGARSGAGGKIVTGETMTAITALIAAASISAWISRQKARETGAFSRFAEAALAISSPRQRAWHSDVAPRIHWFMLDRALYAFPKKV